jgi:hypothetical protein
MEKWADRLRLAGLDSPGWRGEDFERFIAAKYLRLLNTSLGHRLRRKLGAFTERFIASART